MESLEKVKRSEDGYLYMIDAKRCYKLEWKEFLEVGETSIEDLGMKTYIRQWA
jgi:hypothetical protein